MPTIAPPFDVPVTTVTAAGDLSEACDPRIGLGYAYWQAKVAACPSGHLPGRQQLRPEEMVAFLPCVLLFDVERTGTAVRFRHRLTGTHFFDLFGRDVTNLYIEETGSKEDMAVVQARFVSVVTGRQPIYGVAPVPAPGREFLHYEYMTAPLASDGINVDMLFGVRCALWTARRLA